MDISVFNDEMFSLSNTYSLPDNPINVEDDGDNVIIKCADGSSVKILSNGKSCVR